MSDDVVISLDATDEGLGSALDESQRMVQGWADSSLEAFNEVGDGGGASMGSLMGTVTALSTGFLAAVEAINIVVGAVMGLKDTIVGFVTSAGEAEIGMARLDALNQASGQSAGYTTQQLDEMATQLSELAVIEDDVVKSAEAMLLKFKNIKGDTFRDAMMGAADLAAALGQDLTSATQMVGRALEDPVQGLNMLRRSGVIFSQAQKDVIQSLVDTGDIAGAQKVILDELAERFGGTAEKIAGTFPKRMEMLQLSLGEVGEAIGGMLIPVIDKFMPVLDAVVNGFENFTPIIGSSVDKMVEIGEAIQDILQPMLEWLADAGLEVIAQLSVMIQGIAESFGLSLPSIEGTSSALRDVAETIVSYLRPAFEYLMDARVAVFSALQIAVENWRDVFELSSVGIAHQVVRTYEVMKHYFTEVIPEVLKWFGENWITVLDDVANFQVAILSNMGKNVMEFVRGVTNLLTGSPADFKFTALLEGFEMTTKELPKIAERIEGETEKALRERTEELGQSLADKTIERFEQNQQRIHDRVNDMMGGLSDLFSKGEKEAPDLTPNVPGADDDPVVKRDKDKKEKIEKLTLERKKTRDKEKQEEQASKAGGLEGLEALYNRIASATGKISEAKKDDKAGQDMSGKGAALAANAMAGILPGLMGPAGLGMAIGNAAGMGGGNVVDELKSMNNGQQHGLTKIAELMMESLKTQRDSGEKLKKLSDGAIPAAYA